MAKMGRVGKRLTKEVGGALEAELRLERTRGQRSEGTKTPTATAAAVVAATWTEVGGRTIATAVVRCVGLGTKEAFRFQPCASQSSASGIVRWPAAGVWNSARFFENCTAILFLVSHPMPRWPPENPHTWCPRTLPPARWGCSFFSILLVPFSLFS